VSNRLKHDTATFLDISGELLRSGYAVRFRAHGSSMRPAIRDGEAITVESVEPAAVKPGDVLFYRQRQRAVAHRVISVSHKGDNVVEFIVRGDAKAACDAPVKPSQVLGRVLPEGRDSRRETFLRRAARLVLDLLRRA
jgi:signal peptidase I